MLVMVQIVAAQRMRSDTQSDCAEVSRTRQQSPMALNSTPHFAAAKYARLAGCAYLAVVLLGLFGETWVRGTLLVPSLAEVLFPAILVPAFVGVLAPCLWLMVKGVESQAWQSQVTESNSSK
jgi:hypothetical protein